MDTLLYEIAFMSNCNGSVWRITEAYKSIHAQDCVKGAPNYPFVVTGTGQQGKMLWQTPKCYRARLSLLKGNGRRCGN